ncbi:putative HECT domain-containing ubiquitin-transferase [Hamiltosporidium tvaerminnensis]|uniref:HECT-type E3 ubiquitin transferase n=1 Tax=Hamiltosporidium tvaerminnensis TaxID=1176355 RepID=A0A4V2JX33_9MICR|nr:putative HECT domain-containing ubiquitin-transferase [Hamiltosporidium tvaerminnensis]
MFLFSDYSYNFSQRKKYKRQKKNINFELNFFVGFLESRIENNLIDLFVNYTGLETKKLILLWNYYKKLVNLQGKFHLAVKRDSVIDSFIENIRKKQPSEVKTQMWFVHFTAEDGTGIGPTFEFFDLYGSILNENEYFIAFANEENTIVEFDKESHQKIKEIYFYTGIVMAKCIIEDLKIIDFEFYTSLISLRNIEENQLNEYNFTTIVKINSVYKSYDLINNGSKIKVSKKNLEDYIFKMTEFKLFRNTGMFFQELKKRFREIFSEPFYKIFTFDELRSILEGETTLDIDVWKLNTKYSSNCHEDHQVIKWLWQYITERMNTKINELQNLDENSKYGRKAKSNELQNIDENFKIKIFGRNMEERLNLK